MKNITILSLALVCTFLLFQSSKNAEIEDQKNLMQNGQKIYPAPRPATLEFAGESVPLSKFGVAERLDRELLVNTYWQSNTMLILKRSKRAFETIDPILEKNGIPADFKYLAIAESGLLNVTSPAGAKGVWQFMPSSGKSYGLKINSQVDERLHLEKSTEAACVYLKEAYNRFGSWSLAAAAYNRGMAGVQRDINKQQVKDYYDLHLNTETARYMLRILAYKQIIGSPKDYGFHLEDKDYYSSVATDNVVVDKEIPDLAVYAKSIGTNYHQLKTLNPWIKGNELKMIEGPYTIKAPR